MKADLTIPPEMIRAIADEVATLLKPMLASKPNIIEDPIFTQEQLADTFRSQSGGCTNGRVSTKFHSSKPGD